MTDVHGAARQGFTLAAQAYARGRPEYPDEILAWLTRDLALAPGLVAVDLGAGTGKFTRLLKQAGAKVIAIEPVRAMREELQAKLGADSGVDVSANVSAVDGTAQQMPLADASADIVVCAQAFHWFATKEALAEIYRVLKPGGRLGLIWNVRDESVDWVAAITAIIAPLEGDTPRFHRGDWRLPFIDNPHFTPLREARFPYRHVGTAQQVIIDRIMSVSFIASLPEAQRRQVERQLSSLVADTPALRDQSLVAFPYQTLAFDCIKR